MTLATIEQKASAFNPLWESMKVDKPVSTYSGMKQVICVSSDEETVKGTNELLTFFNEIKDSLPKDEVDVESAAQQQKIAANAYLVLSAFNDKLHYIINNHKGTVELDDENAIQALDNIKNIIDVTWHIDNYLSIAIDVHNSKAEIKEGAKSYSFEDLKELVAA